MASARKFSNAAPPRQAGADGVVGGTLDISLSDVVRSILELLESQKLHVAQLALEKETGLTTFVGNEYSLFLRRLVIDASVFAALYCAGQWDDVLEYLQPIQQSTRINFQRVRYSVLRCKLLEILCLRFELGDHVLPEALITDCLKELKEACENRQQYNELCFLLGQLSHTGRLQDVPEYRTWNPSLARVECFQQLYALVQPVFEEMFGDADNDNVPSDQSVNAAASVQLKDGRLFSLVAKGLLYESAERLCVRIASSKQKLALDDLDFVPFQSSDKTNSVENMSLLCWLLSLPPQSMRGDFREVPTPIVVEKLSKNQCAPLARFWPMIMVPSTLTTAQRGESVNGVKTGEKDPASSDTAGRDNRMVQSMISQMIDLRNTIRSRPTQDAMALSCYVERSMTAAAFNNANDAEANSRDVNDGEQQRPPTTNGETDDTLISPLDDPKAEHQPISSAERQRANSTNGSDRHQKQQRPRYDNQQHAVRRHDSLTVKSAATHVRQTNNSCGVRPPDALPPFSSNAVKNVAGDNVGVGTSASMLSNDTLLFRISKLNLNDGDAATPKKNGHARAIKKNAGNRSAFYALNILTDQCVLRCAAFHPADGRFYAVGSNSHLLRICAVPQVSRQDIESLAHAADASTSSASDADSAAGLQNGKSLRLPGGTKPSASKEPVVVDQMPCLHNGSIYCCAWNRSGSLIATGSNDKSVKVMSVMPAHDDVLGDILTLSKPERVALHPTTVRSVVFIDDSRTSNSLLLSAGASASNSPTTPNAENSINGNATTGLPYLMLSDVSAAQPIQLFRGHTKTIMSVCRIGGGSQFVSGSEDGTVRLWDVRQSAAQLVLNVAELLPNNDSNRSDFSVIGNGTTAPTDDGAFRVTSLTSNGRGVLDTNLVFVGSKDGRCACWDIRSTQEPVFVCRLHSSEIRSLSYDPLTKSLLSAGFDGNVMLTSVSRASVGSAAASRGALVATPVVQTNDVKYVTVEWHPGAYVAASPSSGRQASLNGSDISKKDQYLRFVTTSTAKECILWIADPQLYDA